IVNVAVAAVASVAWRVVSDRIEFLSPAARARVIIGLRVMPVVLAVVFVAAFVVPSYLLLEPQESGEIVSLKMGLIALASSIAVLVAVFRVVRTWYVTRRLLKNWLSNSTDITVAGIDGRVHLIEHPFPVIGVIGVFRSRVFVARHVLDALDENELAAAIYHENGHRASFDNLKRSVLRMCRDLVILPIGGRLDDAWAETAESAADEHAAQRGSASALDLASALVKIAKLVPSGTTPVLPVGAYLVEKGDEISSRVEHLIALSETSHRASLIYGRLSTLLGFVAICAILILPLIDNSTLAATHDVVERFVAALQ
ncbi:MAG TPA: M56 family metallopeptidase, partial [Pyrinomonadaceae bacterium]